MDSESIRLTIRHKLAAGSLPHNSIPRFWGGPPNGEDCDACDEVIKADELLIEGISTLTNEGIQMHVLCFSMWDEERDVLGRV